MTRLTKTLLYAAATALLIGLSWSCQASLTLADAAPFTRALGWLIAVGVVLTGVGVFLRRGADAVFLDAVGGVTLTAGVILFFLYGGMENTALAGTDTAMNLAMTLWTALPLAFAVRTAALGWLSREDSRARRRVATLVPLVLAAVIAVLLVTGQMLHFVHQSPAEGTDDMTDVYYVFT